MIARGILAASRSASRRLRAEERGMTVVEGVVAALLLVVGALGVLQVFDTSTRNNFRAEQSQVLNNRLQGELERIQRLPYAEIALTEYPVGSADANDPRVRVAGTRFAVDRSGSVSSQQDLVVKGSTIPGSELVVTKGSVPPGPEPFSTGDISGEIYRFITWTPVADCPHCEESVMKRVVVAAKVEEAPVSFDRAFQEVHTDIPNPEVRPDPNPAPPGEEVPGNTAELWLTDTTCDKPGRLAPEVPHTAHNTRGLCLDGKADGQARGAPDLMFVEAPPEADPENDPPLGDHDFSADLSGSQDGVGLSMPWEPAETCELEPVLDLGVTRKLLDGAPAAVIGEPDPHDGVLDLPGTDPGQHHRIHKWLSPRVSEEGESGLLTGEGTFDLWTRTVDGAIYPGEVCVTLFIRHTIDVPVLPTEVEVCEDGMDCPQTVEVDPDLVDLESAPPTLCGEAQGVDFCVDLEVTPVELEVDVPLHNVGPLANVHGLVCQQGLHLTYFQCGMTPSWPAEWSKVSIPMKFVGVDSSGQEVPIALPPESRVGLSLMAREYSAGQAGAGLEFMYDHVDFESRLQLRADSAISFEAG